MIIVMLTYTYLMQYLKTSMDRVYKYNIKKQM